jgi:hypothetical protein
LRVVPLLNLLVGAFSATSRSEMKSSGCIRTCRRCALEHNDHLVADDISSYEVGVNP